MNLNSFKQVQDVTMMYLNSLHRLAKDHNVQIVQVHDSLTFSGRRDDVRRFLEAVKLPLVQYKKDLERLAEGTVTVPTLQDLPNTVISKPDTRMDHDRSEEKQDD